DESGADRVDAHAGAGEFIGCGLNQADDAGLAGAVGHATGARTQSGDRRRTDDRAAPLPGHRERCDRGRDCARDVFFDRGVLDERDRAAARRSNRLDRRLDFRCAIQCPTEAPSAASSSALARPIPLVAPVTKAVLACNRFMRYIGVVGNEPTRAVLLPRWPRVDPPAFASTPGFASPRRFASTPRVSVVL